MKRRARARVTTGLLVALLAAGSLGPPAAEAIAGGVAPPADADGWRTVPVGLCEDYPEETRDLARVRKDLEALRAAGVRSLRVSIGWDGIEPRDDAFDLSFWDQFVRIAVDELGLTLLPYVCYTPKWAARHLQDAYRSPPRDVAEFAEVMRLLAARYRGRVHTWELWNEPDNHAYWTGSAADYAALLRAGAAAVRAAAPEARVVLGGIAWDLDFLREVLAAPGAAEAADVINLHAYYETWSPEPLERLTGYVREAADLVAELGRGQPLWMAEVGYSSFRRGRAVSAQYRARYDHEHTAEHQAGALVRTVALLLSSGVVERVAWYELRDLPPDEEVIGDVNNRHLGVLDPRGAPKPAYAALQLVTRLFAGGFRGVDGELQVTRRGDSAAEVHGFARPDGSVVLVAWLPTVRAGVRAAEGPGDGADRRVERVEVQLPAGLGDLATGQRLDAAGRRRGDVTIAPAEAGGASAVALELRGGEVAVVVLEAQRG